MEKYSRTLGNILTQSLKKFVTPDSLPDERLYYNIAQTVLEPMLKDNYEFVNDLASQVQKSIDSKAKIQLNPQKAIYPIERINQVINAVSDVNAEWETIQRRLDSPVCTVTESFYDDYVKENAKFRNDSGLNCYITRTASANCCKWCSSLAGRYAYSDAPPDIYRRHDNCTCTVTFENGKTRQDVWSKKTWEVKETPKENYKPKKFSNEQAKAVQQENLQYKGIKNNLISEKLVDNPEKSGIMKKRDGKDRANEFSANWSKASLKEFVEKFKLDKKSEVNPTGKIIYSSDYTNITVVYDVNGNYFRIQDKTIPQDKRSAYLDINGNSAQNIVENGKTRGRTKKEFQRDTHFLNTDNKE